MTRVNTTQHYDAYLNTVPYVELRILLVYKIGMFHSDTESRVDAQWEELNHKSTFLM